MLDSQDLDEPMETQVQELEPTEDEQDGMTLVAFSLANAADVYLDHNIVRKLGFESSEQVTRQ